MRPVWKRILGGGTHWIYLVDQFGRVLQTKRI